MASTTRLGRHLALLGLVLVAAVLRYTGIGWGLRHTPHVDEHYFVQYTGWMLDRGDLDHLFYEYPALLFYILAPVLAFHHPPDMGPGAYLAARVVFATFGIASVVLTHRLASPLVGPIGAFVAAALVAVSPLEVRTAHMVRPDVVLETFVLLALLAFRREPLRPHVEALAGAALGLATAVKFSAVLLAPSYIAQRLGQGRFRWPGALLAAAVSLVTFAVLSPYTFLNAREAFAGAAHQVKFHYADQGQPAEEFSGMLGSYGWAAVEALGPLGMAAVLAGALIWRREWRQWAPLAMLPVVTILVFSTADVRRVRFLIPTLGVLCVFAGKAVAEVFARSRWAGAGVALLVLAPPLTASVRYVIGISQPQVRDRAADWIESHIPPGSRVLTTTAADIGLDPTRYEVLRVDRLDEKTWRQALHADVLLAAPSDDRQMARRLARLATIEPETPLAGPRLLILAVPAEQRPRYLSLAPPVVLASENGERAASLRDGDLGTTWRTLANQDGSPWIEAVFPEPRELRGVELQMGNGELRHQGRNVHVLVPEGSGWRRVQTWHARPDLELQKEPRSQVLLIDPVTVSRLRLQQVAPHAAPWEVAELRLWSAAP